ncbi:hypothetical protein JXB27_01745 [Candidatus Woesearchaeota archaeon]|nr:hypothetical protein [Candidatus Woesearchaeota archaeon]
MDKHYDLKLEKHELEEETEEKIKRKKIAAFVFSIFLALLMLSFIVPHDVLISLIESETINNNTIEKDDVKYYFKPDVLEALQKYYVEHQTAEFKLCLEGFVKDGSYYVTSFYEPKIYFNNPITVHSAICNESTIIDLHSHPLRNCIFSEQDIMTYRMMNREMAGAVMCDIDRFNFYSG